MSIYPGDDLSPRAKEVYRLVRMANAVWTGSMNNRGIRFLAVEVEVEGRFGPVTEVAVYDSAIDNYVSREDLLGWLPSEELRFLSNS